MLDAEEKQKMKDALHQLVRITEREPYCEEETCTIDNPDCEYHQAAAAKRDILAILDPPMQTLQPERLLGYRERIFVDEWIRENTRDSGMGGCTKLLEIILSTKKRQGLGGPEPVTDFISLRDAQVATSVVQWFGTNCGQSFLYEVNRKIEKEREDNKEVLPTYYAHDLPGRDLFSVLEDRILQDIIPLPFHAENFRMGKDLAVHLRAEVKKAFRVLMALFALETGMASREEAARTAGFHEKTMAKVQEKARRAVKKRVEKLRSANLANTKVGTYAD